MYKINRDFITFVENNPKLVTRRESTRYPGLYVIKYTRKVFYDALWNDVLEECRGLVVDKDWNTVVLPFKKIYNRGENGTDFSLDQSVICVRKINGFMAAATYSEAHDEVIVSTTGSLDSEFAILAEKWIKPSIAPWIKAYGRNITWLFEICDPTDPHIINELPGVYLIGNRVISYGGWYTEGNLDLCSMEMGAIRPHHYTTIFREVVEEVKYVNHEGFVVHNNDLVENRKSLKIKSPYYLITKFLGRVRNEKLEKIISDRQNIDEEFYPLLDYIENHNEVFKTFDEQQKIKFIREFLANETMDRR